MPDTDTVWIQPKLASADKLPQYQTLCKCDQFWNCNMRTDEWINMTRLIDNSAVNMPEIKLSQQFSPEASK